MTTKETDFRRLSFEDLLDRYGYLIERHAHEHLRSCAPIMDADDFRQELREVLWRAQQNFLQPSNQRHGVPRTTLEFWFIGYLNRAMWNRARKRAWQLTGVKKRVPPGHTVPLEGLIREPGVEDAYDVSDLSGWGGLSPDARRLAECALLGYAQREFGRAAGLSSRRVREGVAELRRRAEMLDVVPKITNRSTPSG